jgi:hypothetical protein
MRPVVGTLLAMMMVALCTTQAVNARTSHRAPKITAPAPATKSDAKIPVEANRDPADVALDRRIKGICKGC